MGSCLCATLKCERRLLHRTAGLHRLSKGAVILGNFSCNLSRKFVAPLRDKLHATLPSRVTEFIGVQIVLRRF